ncbi:MAG: hypothetical protein U0235_16985 [Polyangiaceae bacterium]
MKALRRWLIGTSVFAFLAVGTGCSSQAEDDSEETEGALGEDSGKIVQTSQTDLLLYQGYNSVFDKGRGGCVSYGSSAIRVGDVGFDVKIAWVRSREELSRQLGFDAEASFKLPVAGVDGRTEVMNSFKKSASSTSLLVRVGSYYAIDAGQSYQLTPEAKSLLQSDPRGFLQRCGDAVLTKLQYRAEVLGLLRFDTNDQERSTKAAASAGVDAPKVATVADAKAKVGGSVDRMKQSSKGQLSLQLFTSGFNPNSGLSVENLQGDGALNRLGELLGKMGESIANDRKAALDGVRAGSIPVQPAGTTAPAAAPPPVENHAKLAAITYHMYGENDSMPVAPITQMTQDHASFLRDVGRVQGHLESAYYEEVNAFATASDQETYNLVSTPKATLAELGPIAQSWSNKLRPTDTANLVSKLKDAELACVRFALTGDFSKCTMTDDLRKLIADGQKQLDDYAANGRVLRMNILYGSQSEVTVDAAKAACARTGGRLPTDQEMQWLRPAVAQKGGVAWVTSTQCPKSIGIWSGQGKPNCYNGWYMDWYDSILDTTGLSQRAAPVFCVGTSGPKSLVLAPPGE